MNQNTGSIQTYAKKLISVDSSASIQKIYSIMLAEEISYLPIIDHDGKNNIGVYKRKDLFEWLVMNPEKDIQNQDKSLFKQDPLPEVEMRTPLQEIMSILHNNSAILIKNDGRYTYLISPKVAANALQEYSARFFVYETLEEAIRKRISHSNIDLNELNGSNLDKTFPEDPEQLDFGQYITVISKKWDEMGLNHLDKKTIIGYLNNAQQYRNALMHFRLNDKVQGLEDAKKILTLLQS